MKSKVLPAAALILASASSVMAGPREDAVAPAASAPATAAPAAKSLPEVQINFANHGGIWDWSVVDDKTLLIQDRSRRWYKATLLVNCIDLPFDQKLGFESNPDGSFDKFSAIQTRGQRCPLISLVRTDAPVSKKSKKTDAAKAPSVTPTPAPTADVRPMGER
jgi:Family of unknown function (DUF6491)